MQAHAQARTARIPAAVALFIALFLLFTPFEQGGPNPSMFPKYFSAGVSALALAPLFIITRIRFRVESQLVLVTLAMFAFHALVVKPVPFHFLLLVVLNVVLAIVIYEASFTWRAEFVKAVSWLLVLNAVVIAAQALMFHVLGGPIFDFHKVIFGSNSRFVEDFLNIARFSGLHVEPGTYANYIACLAVILMLTSGFSARFIALCFMAVLSVFLTNSGSSVYFVPVMVLLLGYLWRSKVRALHIALLAVSLYTYMLLSGVLEHLETRFLEQDDGSLSHRIHGVNVWLALTLEEKLIGVGFANDPCVRCYYQDIGMIFNLLTRGGIVVVLAFALVVGRMLVANGLVLSMLLMLIPINEKMFFYEAPIWLFLLFAMTPFVRRNAAAGATTADAAGTLAAAGAAQGR
ncbi:O-antigen ligase family protein [Massilia sp. BSC265]|uniref:O-antigen ligase family protein n=1 Tax=Massilia sp. BSC265 TaxID=1549812 RepID=UPI0004E955A5|nr:O-antigen ligase family protein [Massilia sp. BSC265]KFI05836.1 hypothetical protein JN27_20665 [Massilia sp. BSC265]